MSRVRILNLPNDCTEAQLKQHLLRTAPREAPLLEITDVQFIRRPITAKDRVHRLKQHQKSSAMFRGGGGAGATTARSILRMAFVGFRTSAAAHFVVQYFNDSFFHSARLRVELAKGLEEVGVTHNQLQKQQLHEAKAKASNSGERVSTLTSSTTSKSESEVLSRKRGRGEDGNAETEKSTGGRDAAKDSLVRRQRDFVEQRSKVTEGPTWAADILLAPEPPTNSLTGSTEGQASTETINVVHDSTNKLESSAAVVTDEATLEQLALTRQQALGEVNDMDFLAGLGGLPSTAAAPKHLEATAPGGDQAEADRDGAPKRRSTEAREAKATPSTDKQKETRPEDHRGEDDDPLAQEDIARLSRRVHLRNIPYIATEEHLKQFASSLVGPVEAVHIPLTKDTRQNKGAAFVRFVSGEDAVRALQRCRGTIFMGRLLRVSAAEEDPHSKRVLEREAAQASTAAAQGGIDGVHGSGGSLAGSSQFKKQREAERRGDGDGTQAQMTWNTMYMNSHAAVDTVANRLGVRAEDVVGVTAKGAAVRAAIAEAYLTSEVQQVLSDEGIAFDLLEGAARNLLKARSNTTILVKNVQLKDGSDAAELTKLFVRFGTLETSAFPSAGAFALFRYAHPQDARVAFTRLSYKMFKTAPLFLEWAPVGALVEDGEDGRTVAAELGLKATASADGGADTDDATASSAAMAKAMVYTLFITNIPFHTSEDELHAFLLDACPRLARTPELLIRRLVLQQEQGRAFLTVADQSTLTYTVSKVNGRTLGGRTLSCVVSNQTAQLLQQRQLLRTTGAGGEEGEEGTEQTTMRRGGADGIRVRNGRDRNDDDEAEDPTKTSVIARQRGSPNAGGSHTSPSSSKVPPGCNPLKLIVKNLPFEATLQDVRDLVSAFSEIRTVRLPQKRHTFSSHRENNHRGFAFVEFLSEAEAARARETLKSTHLYGRHLVLEYAKLDD